MSGVDTTENKRPEAMEKEKKKEQNAPKSERAEEVRAALDKQQEQLVKIRDMLVRGSLVLKKPMRARSEDVLELFYDYEKLTGTEYINAMDSDRAAGAEMSAKQGLALFALAAAKCTDGMDERDIKERAGVEDVAAMVKLSQTFFKASAGAAKTHSAKE